MCRNPVSPVRLIDTSQIADNEKEVCSGIIAGVNRFKVSSAVIFFLIQTTPFLFFFPVAPRDIRANWKSLDGTSSSTFRYFVLH